MRTGSIVIALLVGMCAFPAFAVTNYTKTIDLPPLRISIVQLQEIVSKGASLMKLADSSAPPFREDMEMSKAGFSVKITGNQLDADRAKIPDVIDAFEYSASTRDPAPVSQLHLSFRDFTRTLSVEGQSPDQVDAVFSALRDDLSMLSSPFGGAIFKALFRYFGFVLSVTLVMVIIATWFVSRRLNLIAPISVAAIFVTLSWLLSWLLPFDEIFAGFSALRGDASFIVQYGPDIAFLDLVTGVFAILLTLILEQKKTTASPTK
jgi:hypothetical protein